MHIYIDDGYNRWRHAIENELPRWPVNVAAHFLWHFHRLLISNVNFFVFTKHWSPILLSKLAENYAALGKWIKCIYVNFGVHWPLSVCLFIRWWHWSWQQLVLVIALLSASINDVTVCVCFNVCQWNGVNWSLTRHYLTFLHWFTHRAWPTWFCSAVDKDVFSCGTLTPANCCIPLLGGMRQSPHWNRYSWLRLYARPWDRKLTCM